MNPIWAVLNDPTVRARAYALIRQIGSMAAGALTGWLVAKGVGLAEATILAGSVVALGGAIGSVAWSMIEVSSVDKKIAVGVAAGINMTVQGKALAADGVTLVSKNDGATPPLQPTVATAAKIVADFGPPASTITKS